MQLERQHAGAIYVAVATMLWALWPVWVRQCSSGAQAATLGLIVAAIGGTPLALIERRRAAPRFVRPRSAWALLCALGVTDAANAWFYFRALAEGAVAPAVLSHYIAPVLVALAAPVFLGEPRGARTPLALVLAFVGTAALVLVGRENSGGDAFVHAALLGGASAVFYASNVILARRLASWFGNSEMMAWHAYISAGLLFIITGLPADAVCWRWLLAGGLVSSLAAGLIYYAGLRRIPAERAGILTFIEPVAAVAVGWFVFAETPGPGAAIGGALILAAGLLVVTSPSRATGAHISQERANDL